jgi:DNA-binding XRE family transcriptional regulator
MTISTSHIQCRQVFLKKMILIVRGPFCIIMLPSLLMMGHQVNEIKLLFGNRIRQLRKARGLSQEAFADLCQLDRTYVGGIERGERNVSLVNISKLADALDISPKELFRFDNGK